MRAHANGTFPSPKFENNFEAGFSGVEVYDVLTPRSPLKKSETSTLEK
jgi:hypothetical protein